MTLIKLTAYNAWRRGFITDDQYEVYLQQNPDPEQEIIINYDEHLHEVYLADVHVLKRDPNAYIDLVFSLDGAGAEIADAKKAYARCNVSGRIIKATVLADQSGSIAIDVWKKTTYPPADGESITASAVPTITTNVSSEDATLTGWNVMVTAGDYFIANVDSCTTITHAELILTIEPAVQYVRIV